MSVNEHEMQIINDAFNSENNLISRQTVLEQTYLWSKDEFLRVTNPFDYLRKRINDISSVNPQEPKTGHWIVHPNGIFPHLVCDKCLSYAPYDCQTNYCPNCGCRMVEQQESEVSK